MLRTLALLLICLPVFAHGKAWVVDPERSEIFFDYTRANQPDQGQFRRFAGEGSFDPAEPEAAELEIRIESRSIDLNDDLASAFATSAEWFDSKNHPQVTYRLDTLEPQADGSYRATGQLTIRGKTETVSSPIRLAFAEDGATADGEITVDRRSYLLGVGPSAAFVTIGPEVTVRFRLRAVQPQ